MGIIALGLWYVKIPCNQVVNPQGEIIEVKEHNGSKFVWVNRKRKTINSLPKLSDEDISNFKEVFC